MMVLKLMLFEAALLLHGVCAASARRFDSLGDAHSVEPHGDIATPRLPISVAHRWANSSGVKPTGRTVSSTAWSSVTYSNISTHGTTRCDPGSFTRSTETNSYNMTTEASRSNPCTSLRPGQSSIHFVVVYTSTVTFTGHRGDYTAPFESLYLPTFCPPPASSASTSTPTLTPPDAPSSPPRFSSTASLPSQPGVITFITTDKNPAVVYPPETAPHFIFASHAPDPLSASPNSRKTAVNGDGTSIEHVSRAGRSATLTSSLSTFVVSAGGNQVVINDQSFTNLKAEQSSTVVVDRGTFTIYPSAVVGGGMTVMKPTPSSAQIIIPTPATTVLDGITLVLSGPSAYIDGTSFAISEGGFEATLNGHTVCIKPGKIVVGADSFAYPTTVAEATSIVVGGGEMLTAIGSSVVVLRSTTYTYGPGIPNTNINIDDDIITLRSSEVVADGATFGGSSADPTDTAYHIVGGVTLTESGSSAVVLNSATYTVGPSAQDVTVTYRDETITFGSDGFRFATLTFDYPFGSTVTTIQALAAAADEPVEIDGSDGRSDGGNNGENDDDQGSAFSVRPIAGVGLAGLCMAIGTWVMA